MDNPAPYNLALALANSGISDEDLLYISDARFFVTQPDEPEAQRCFARHKLRPHIGAVLEQACRVRKIDSATGTKVVTSTIDLLA